MKLFLPSCHHTEATTNEHDSHSEFTRPELLSSRIVLVNFMKTQSRWCSWREAPRPNSFNTMQHFSTTCSLHPSVDSLGFQVKFRRSDQPAIKDGRDHSPRSKCGSFSGILTQIKLQQCVKKCLGTVTKHMLAFSFHNTSAETLKIQFTFFQT